LRSTDTAQQTQRGNNRAEFLVGRVSISTKQQLRLIVEGLQPVYKMMVYQGGGLSEAKLLIVEAQTQERPRTSRPSAASSRQVATGYRLPG